MTSPSPAQDFLCEVADLAGFIDDVLALPRGSRWHWPSYYLFYVEADRLDGMLVRMGWLFEPASGTLIERRTAEEEAEAANALFAQVDKCQQAIVGWLSHMWRNTRAVAARSAARDRLEAHFHPKSGWYQLFRERHRAGRISGDGATLACTVLGIDAASSRNHISYDGAECMLRCHSFELDAPGMKPALAAAVEHARTRLGRTLAAMDALLVEHCTIEELLHPSSR